MKSSVGAVLAAPFLFLGESGMSQWRREALARFPELHREIANAEGIFLFWHILRHQMLLPAYKKEPPDLETAARVFDYAAWCWKHRSPRVRQAVADEFYDYLGDYPKTRAEMQNAGGNAALAVFGAV